MLRNFATQDGPSHLPNSAVMLGFFKFLLGMTLFLFVTGYFILHQDEFGPKRMAALMMLLLLLFVAHAPAFGAGVVVVATLAIALLLRRHGSLRSRTLMLTC